MEESCIYNIMVLNRYFDFSKELIQLIIHKYFNLFSIKKIICGKFYSFAITNSNEVYVWGDNICGQLGLGHDNNVNSPQKLNFN